MDKVNVTGGQPGWHYLKSANMPVVAEAVEREQPEHLRACFPRAAGLPIVRFRIAIPTYEPKVK